MPPGALTWTMVLHPCQSPRICSCAMRSLSPQFEPYAWALSTADIARHAGVRPQDLFRFDGNTPPEPHEVARPEVVADALARINTYAHGGFPELLDAIAAYAGVEPGN